MQIELVDGCDQNKVIQKLMSDGMSHEEALEGFDFNIIGAWAGDRTPHSSSMESSQRPSGATGRNRGPIQGRTRDRPRTTPETAKDSQQWTTYYLLIPRAVTKGANTRPLLGPSGRHVRIWPDSPACGHHVRVSVRHFRILAGFAESLPDSAGLCRRH